MVLVACDDWRPLGPPPARHHHGPTKHTLNIENQRLRTALEPILPTGQAGETMISKRKSDETVADG